MILAPNSGSFIVEKKEKYILERFTNRADTDITRLNITINSL